MNPWSLTYEGFDPAHEGLREALCTLGNGRFATRGAAPEAEADAVHYPGTYVAGCYDRLTSIIAGHELTHEDMVNLPNWLPLTFATPGSAWFSPGTADLLRYRQELDMRHAVLHRLIRWRDPEAGSRRCGSAGWSPWPTPAWPAWRRPSRPRTGRVLSAYAPAWTGAWPTGEWPATANSAATI